MLLRPVLGASLRALEQVPCLGDASAARGRDFGRLVRVGAFLVRAGEERPR